MGAPAAIVRLAVFVCALSSAATVHAGNEYVIFGAGSRPCGNWLQLRSQALPDSVILQSWVLGYVTSINANLLSVSQDVSGGAAPDALYSWIDNYCASHPLDSVARATSARVDAMLVQNKAK